MNVFLVWFQNDDIQDGLVVQFKSSNKAVKYYSKHISESLNALHVHSQDTNILLSVPQKMADDYRQRLTEELFESFNFNSVFFVCQPLLAAYSSSYTNCLVVDSGYSNTGILAVKDLYPLPPSERMLPFGGKHVDRYLRRLCGDQLNANNEADLHYIKSNYCSLAPKDSKSGTYVKRSILMPDGQTIFLSEDHLRQAPEMLFNPSLGGLPAVMPIDQAAIRSALALDENDGYAVFETVLLAGGNTAFPGARSRMQLGIATRTVPRINRRVVKHQKGTDAVWLGGAAIGSTQTYAKVCINRKDYAEIGSRIASERWLWESAFYLSKGQYIYNKPTILAQWRWLE